MKFRLGASGMPDLEIDLDELGNANVPEDALPECIALMAAHVIKHDVSLDIVVPLAYVCDDGEEIFLPGGADELIERLNESLKLAAYMNEEVRYNYNKEIYAYVSEEWRYTDFDNLDSVRDMYSGEYGDDYSDREEFWKERACELHGGPGDRYEDFIDWDRYADSEEESCRVIDWAGTHFVFNE